MRLLIYRIDTTHTITECIVDTFIEDDMFVHKDYDMVFDDQPTVKPLNDKNKRFQHTVTIEHNNREPTVVKCKSNGNYMLQIGRHPYNDIVVDAQNPHSTFPRYCMRLCKSRYGTFYIKTAGFDQHNNLFLPSQCTVLPKNDYSTSNPLWYVPRQYVDSMPKVGIKFNFFKEHCKAISISGNYFSWSQNRFIKVIRLGDNFYPWNRSLANTVATDDSYVLANDIFICGHFVIVFK